MMMPFTPAALAGVAIQPPATTKVAMLLTARTRPRRPSCDARLYDIRVAASSIGVTPLATKRGILNTKNGHKLNGGGFSCGIHWAVRATDSGCGASAPSTPELSLLVGGLLGEPFRV